MLYRWAYHTLIATGRPFGGIRPRRLYDYLGRRAYPTAQYQWFKNNWGLDLNLSHHFHLDRNILIFGEYDTDLHQLIQTRVQPGMVALDVGANIGEMALHMALRVGPAGKVWAFEPMPFCYARLVEHIARNHLEDRLRPCALALGSTTGILPMTFPADDADNPGLGSLVNPHAGPVKTSVKVDTLDVLAQREGLTHLDFIKVDIQGGEYDFLQGARQTLSRFKPDIIMEVSPGDLHAAGRNSRELLQLVESLGYDVYTIHAGKIAQRLSAQTVPLDFAAVNVACIPTKTT